MATPSQPALDPTSPLLQQLRDLLLAAGYHNAGLAPTIDDRGINLPDDSAPATTLNTLIRLFFIAEDCSAQDVAAALQPLSVQQLTQAGILRPGGDNENLSAQFRIQPYENLLFMFHHPDPDAPPEEAMMLISISARAAASSPHNSPPSVTRSMPSISIPRPFAPRNSTPAGTKSPTSPSSPAISSNPSAAANSISSSPIRPSSSLPSPPPSPRATVSNTPAWPATLSALTSPAKPRNSSPKTATSI
jgi:hypothetical protein